MKKKLTLFLVALVGVLSMSAQNGKLPAEVANPGYKGALPEVPAVAPARQGEIPILNLYHVGLDSYIVNGNAHINADLSFPWVSEVGCDYYTVQYRQHGTTAWTSIMDGDSPRHYGGNDVGVSPRIYGVTDYRLVLHGGEKDGYVSNTVTATPPSMYSRWTGWSEDPTIERALVNIPVGEELSFSAQTYKDGNLIGYSTEENPEYFSYQWYRRNPNNFDMEKIEGATAKVYTPTIEDAGYQLVVAVGGDKVHLDYTLYHFINDVVKVPVQASIAYIGSDGFILNTDYVIPNPQQTFVLGETWMEEPPVLDPSCISEREPGQYVFRMSEEQFAYCAYELANPAYYLTFYYEMMGWYREVQIMPDRYKEILAVKAELNGKTVPAIIDVIGQNIDGQWVKVASMSMEEATDGVLWFTDEYGSPLVYQQPCYIRANATASTETTYYPSSLTMSGAQTIIPDIDYETWEPIVFTINVQGEDIPDEGSDAWLLLWQKDGGIAAYHLNTHPRIKYDSGDFLIISDEVDIAYPVEEVRKFTLCKDLTDYEDAIGRVPEEEQIGNFSFDKARPGSLVNIYDMSGRKVSSYIVGADGSLQYSLDNQPAGVYIIKTETTTIKIIKK